MKRYIFLTETDGGDQKGSTVKWDFDSITRQVNGSSEVNISTDKALEDYNDDDVALNNSVTIRVASDKLGGTGLNYFSGYIARKSIISDGNQEQLKLRVFSHASKLFQAIWRVGTTIVHDFTAGSTVTTIVKQIIDNYRTLDSNARIDYTEASGGDAGTVTVNPIDDGWAGRQGVDESWATIRAANGTIKRGQADGTSEAIALRCSSTSNQFDLFRRGLINASLASVPSNATITGVKFRAYVNSKSTTLGSQSLTIANGSMAGSAIAASDFEGNVSNTTVWGDTIALSSITTSAYNEWNFNATGIAAAQSAIGGSLKFSLVWESDRTNSQPTWGSGNIAEMNWNFGNAASNKSEVVVTYTTPSDITTQDSVENTTTTIKDKYEGITFGEALNRAAALAYTANRAWYWRILGDNVFTLKKASTTADHSFIYGKHISTINLSQDLINSANEAFIYYNNATVNRYSNSSNITSYGYISKFERETNVTDTTTSGNIGNAIIEGLLPPILKITITVNDTYEDGIETIDPGDTCEILNIPEDIAALLTSNMLITKTIYRKDEVDIELEIKQPQVQSSLDNLRRKFEESRTEGLPTTFSNG